MAKKPSPAPGADMARRIWLAGIGAYGNAFTEAQASLSKVSGDTSRAFDDLVTKGELIEKTVEMKSQEVVKKVAAGPGVFSLDDRIKQMRSRLGIGDIELPARSSGGGTAPDLEARLEVIEEKLDNVLALLSKANAMPVKKKAVKRNPTRKTTAKKS